LENVFLKLCVKDQTHTSEESYEAVVSKANERIIANSNRVNDERIEKMKKRRNSCMHTVVSKPRDEIKKALKFPKWNNLKGLLFKNSLLMRRDIGCVSHINHKIS
jgi:hypothetical protein